MFIKRSKIIKLGFVLFAVIINSLCLQSCVNKIFFDNETISNDRLQNNSVSINEENYNDKESYMNDDYIEINLTSDNLNIYKSDRFVLLKEFIPNIREEMQYYFGTNFIGDRIDGYEGNYAILTKEAAEALKKVNDELNKLNLGIVVYDAYRPMRAVKQFVEWTKDEEDTKMKKEFYPNVEKSMMLKSGYLSSKSGHARGSTIDISLYNLLTLQNLDMGGPFDYFGEKSHFNYEGLTAEQKHNRKLLRDIMTKYGFKGISTEWWHFTLIDEPYKDEYFDFPVSKKLDVVYDDNKKKRISIDAVGDYIDAKGNIDYKHKNKKYITNDKEIGANFVNEDLKAYLNGFKDVLSEEEIKLVIHKMPFLKNMIYEDLDYNDYTKDEMEEILNILLKIYDKEKLELEVKFFDTDEDSYYVYGYNKSFLISNIISLKRAIDRKNRAYVDLDKLPTYKYNADLNSMFYILSVSELKEDAYYEVELIGRQYILRDLMLENTDNQQRSAIKSGDVIDIYGIDIRNVEEGYRHYIYTLLGKNDRITSFDLNGEVVTVENYDLEKIDYIYPIYKVRILKNAIIFDKSEDYHEFEMDDYYSYVDIDYPINNLSDNKNLFMDNVHKYNDKANNIKQFQEIKNYIDDAESYISLMVFDNKGYVAKLYKYKMK